MEIEVGTFEAKNRLSELLAQAERGGRIYITRRGKRVAVLTGLDREAREDPRATLRRFRKLRKSAQTGPESLKALVEDGRRR